MRARSGRLLSAALVVTVSAAAVWHAAASPGDGVTPPFAALKAEAKAALTQAAQQVASPVPPPAPELVWEGVDIDGDGASDFANPTGLAPRVHDGFGSGAFGASRDGGSRKHAGVDYEAVAGAEVQAPMSGFVSRIGQAYADDPTLKYVEITNPALKHTARVLYMAPEVVVGQAVAMGATIGRVESLQGRYPGITDHVHLEIAAQSLGKRDPGELIVARMERPEPQG